MKKRLLIPIIIFLAILAIIVIAFLLLQSKEQQVKFRIINGDDKFRLINGDTAQPVSNKKILICDDSLKLNYVWPYPYSRFCDSKIREIWGETTTDASGIFSIDINKIDVKAVTNIVFDPGNSDVWWGKVDIERSDSLSHTFHPSYVRVVNREREGHVISNILYNLKTKEAREIFTSDQSEKNYTFDIINLTIFMKP